MPWIYQGSGFKYHRRNPSCEICTERAFRWTRGTIWRRSRPEDVCNSWVEEINRDFSLLRAEINISAQISAHYTCWTRRTPKNFLTFVQFTDKVTKASSKSLWSITHTFTSADVTKQVLGSPPHLITFYVMSPKITRKSKWQKKSKE